MLPLALSTCEIFTNVFYTFIGLVILGVSHGLIVLPVVLSFVGPTDFVPRVASKDLKENSLAKLPSSDHQVSIRMQSADEQQSVEI